MHRQEAAAGGDDSACTAEHRRRVDEATDAVMRHFDASGAAAQWAEFASAQIGLAPEAFGS